MFAHCSKEVQKGKLDDYTSEGFLIGYYEDSKAYKIWCPKLRRILKLNQVMFWENVDTPELVRIELKECRGSTAMPNDENSNSGINPDAKEPEGNDGLTDNVPENSIDTGNDGLSTQKPSESAGNSPTMQAHRTASQ